MNCSTPDFPVHHQLLEPTQTRAPSTPTICQPLSALILGLHSLWFSSENLWTGSLLWCWRRLLRVPWRLSRRSNKSILKEISPEYSLEGLMLKLKLQYFGHLVQNANSLEKTLILSLISFAHCASSLGIVHKITMEYC